MINKQNIAAQFLTAFLILFVIANSIAQNKETKPFNSVIISPHIEATFEKGDKEMVIIETINVSKDKFNIEVKGKELHLYLEDAKITTPTEKVTTNGIKRNIPIYSQTEVKVKVIYKSANSFTLRGEEKFAFESPLKQEKLNLHIYGESKTKINEVAIANLIVKIYGESTLEIQKGFIKNQKFTAYGESTVNTLGVTNVTTKITAYGEGDYKVNTENDLKVTAYGEAYIGYKGSPNIRKGIIIGDATIESIN